MLFTNQTFQPLRETRPIQHDVTVSAVNVCDIEKQPSMTISGLMDRPRELDGSLEAAIWKVVR